ncbi:lebercilin [Protopterus annectens]|uniref:lebercilin n=1 Tax=Protopterus annectens TaxID=7888 RepID=UPI001CF96D6E|nr:lebercilin [Protopterus annectens]
MDCRNSHGHEETDKGSGIKLHQREQSACGNRGPTALREPFSDTSQKSLRDSEFDRSGLHHIMDSRRDKIKAQDRNSLEYENEDSDSYYSDDYHEDETTARTSSYGSHDRSRSPNVISRSPSPRKDYGKRTAVSPGRFNRVNKKTSSRNIPNKNGPRWGFRSQSLHKESPPKDIDLVTKRVLSARLLKINELRNQVTAQQIKLDELQKENKTLKQLQYRQERALNKFEDTENEISQLISRHSNEVRNLRERLRKAQERERINEKKLKDTEEELHRAKSSLQKLKKLSEDRHLVERDELSRKLVLAEQRLEDAEKRVKELEKNIELTTSSFHRQLTVERKKAREFQEESVNLQEELKHLNQKLKERERELDVRNIYAIRMSKLPLVKDVEGVSRKKGSGLNIAKGVQTEDYFLPVDFPPPPPPAVNLKTEGKAHKVPDVKVKEDLEREERERADHFRQEKEMRDQERERMLKREQEQQALEEKAKKLREEWEKEELERKLREDQLLRDKLIVEENRQHYDAEQRRQLEKQEEEQRRNKEFLLAKMQEIDMERESETFADSGVLSSSQSQFIDSPTKSSPSNRMQRTYKFSEPVENLFNGLPAHGKPADATKSEGQESRGVQVMQSSNDLAFGSYAPSFGKGSGKSEHRNQKDVFLEENPRANSSKRDKKSNLMEQLFGSGASVSVVSKRDLVNPTEYSELSHNTSNHLPWEKLNISNTGRDVFTSDSKRNNSTAKQGSQIAATKSALKVVGSVEDEIEEVIL